MLLEDVCSDLVQLVHARKVPERCGRIHVERQFPLGPSGAFTDLRVAGADEPPYYVEVAEARSGRALIDELVGKYGAVASDGAVAMRLVLVVDTRDYPDWTAVLAELRTKLASVQLEIWDDVYLSRLLVECFGVTMPFFDEVEAGTLLEVFDQARERVAFGNVTPVDRTDALLRQTLLWHFGAVRLRELRHETATRHPAELVPPGSYDGVVVLFADFAGFSRYVRDTEDEAVMRQCLTRFYSRARYQVLHAGGMLANFLGDGVLALFGIPRCGGDHVAAAMQTAQRLHGIGASVAHEWQSRIDHVQPHHGVRVGMAVGRVQLVSMCALDPTRITPIGESVNVAARVMGLGDPGDVVVSNSLRTVLRGTSYEFAEMAPVEAKNVGLIRPWKVRAAA